MSLQWNALSEDDLNGVLQYYGVELENVETGGITSLTTPETTIDIASLHPYYNYVCRVTVVTVSAGPEAGVSFQMPEDGEGVCTDTHLWFVLILVPLVMQCQPDLPTV